MIEVRLFATFREGRKKEYHMDSEKLSTADDVLTALDIPEDEVAILLINGKHSEPKDKIKDGDVVALFPPVGGG